MQILHWPLVCPQQVSTGDFGRSTSLPTNDLPQLTTNNINSVTNIVAQTELLVGCEGITISQGQTFRTDEEMDKQLPTFLETKIDGYEMDVDVQNSSEIQPGTSESGPIVVAQGSERKYPSDDDKPPGDHYKDYNNDGNNNDKQNSENNNEEADEDEENNAENDEEEDEDDGERGFIPFIGNNQESEILRRKNKAALVVNLYPPERGYTICCYVKELEGNDLNEIKVFKESHLIPYSDRYILDCIDREVIPFKLTHKLETVDGANLMKYFSCVVCEIRDYRRFTTNTSKRNAPVVKKVLLKPTNDTLFSAMDDILDKGLKDLQLCRRLMTEGSEQAVAKIENDSNNIEPTEDDQPVPPKRRKMNSLEEITENNGNEESQSVPPSVSDQLNFQELLELESQMALKTYTGLCLDPSKSVGLIANARQLERFKWNTPEVRRAASLLKPVSKEPKISIEDNQIMMNFLQFLSQKKVVEKKPLDKSDLLNLQSLNSEEFPILSPPTNLEELARICQPADHAVLRPAFNENFIRKVEEYTLETERRKRPHTTKLIIYQRNSTESYFGELEQESFAEPNNCNTISSTIQRGPSGDVAPSTKCQFELGSLKNVQLYVRQFTDIFTEDGRRPCKITYQKIGNPVPQVIIINDYKSLNTIAPAGSSPQNLNSTNKSTVTNTNNINTTVNGRNGNNNSLGPQVTATTKIPTVQGPRCSTISAKPKPPMVSQAQSVPISSVAPASVAITTTNNTSVVPISVTVSTQPPVQIVHPQPRSVQQAHIYTTTTQPATIVQQAQNINQGTPANVNVNLNATARVLQQQPLLTRPQIINLNMNSQTIAAGNTTTINYAIPRAQTAAQLLQQQQLKSATTTAANVRPRQPTPTLATLLLSGVQTNTGPKPITVAIQPQPQNPLNHTVQLGSIEQQKQQQQNLQHQLQLVTQQQSQQAQSSQQQPIMIMVSPPTNTNMNPNTSGAQQHANGSVSLNLNAISLESLLNASSTQQSFVTTTSLVSTNTSMNNTASLNRLNILRLSNNTNTVTLSPQHLLRQNAVSLNMNRTNSTAQLMNTGIIINTNANTRNINQQRQIMNNNTTVNRTASIAPAIGLGHIKQEPKCSDGNTSDLEELTVPDLQSLLNSAPVSSNNAGFRGHASGTTTATIDGLNLDLNLNLNLNLSGPGGQPSISASTLNSARTDNTSHQIIYDSGATNSNHLHHNNDGVDSLFNVLSEVIGPDMGHNNSSTRHSSGSSGINVVSSSPTKSSTATNNNNSVITLNDLLASPPIIVSSSAVPQNNGISPTQSPQSPSITSILSPISPNMGASTSHNYNSTPRLSALLAGTPSADSSTILSPTNIFDPASGRGVNVSGTVNSSFGNLLDRLVASSSQPQVAQRAGGSRLNPIATATPMLAATLTQGTTSSPRQGVGGLTRPQTAYRQIAPAPPPNPQPHQQPQQQQLINLLGFVPQSNNNTSSSTQAQSNQAAIRVKANNSASGTSGNISGR